MERLCAKERQNYDKILRIGYLCAMPKAKKYRLNPESLIYEIVRVPLKTRFFRGVFTILTIAALVFGYALLYVKVLKWDLPKTAVLKRINAGWATRMEIMDVQLESEERQLYGLWLRDNDVYRNIFGMDKVAQDDSTAVFGYDAEVLAGLDANSPLAKTARHLDLLAAKAYGQSLSFDVVDGVSRRAGDMASCIPAVPPIMPDLGNYRLTSSFGYRSDPISGRTSFHSGFDFAMKPGNSVFATGDGQVESVSFELFGYGHSVIIDHGFGYKTRYAHMRDIYVVEGMSVKRGECIGETGNTGKSTGPHLHYEVIYRGSPVNPYNFFDLTMPKEEYAEMVSKAASESKNVMVRGRGRNTRKK